MKNMLKKGWEIVCNGYQEVKETVVAAGQKAAMVVVGAVTLGVSAPTSNAAIDTALETVVTDVSGYFDDIKVIVIGVVVFGIAIAYAKLLKRK